MFTYEQTLGRVSRVAAGLRAAGLSKDGKIALISLNCDRYLELFYAIPFQLNSFPF